MKVYDGSQTHVTEYTIHNDSGLRMTSSSLHVTTQRAFRPNPNMCQGSYEGRKVIVKAIAAAAFAQASVP